MSIFHRKAAKEEKELLMKYYNASLEAKAQGLAKAYEIMNEALTKGQEIAEKQEKQAITEPKEVIATPETLFTSEKQAITNENKLSDKQKQLWAIYKSGISQRRIAKELGLKQPTICKRLKVIMKRLSPLT